MNDLNSENSENSEKWRILRSEVFKLKIIEAFELFRAKKIEPILIKGFSNSLYYPQIHQRSYTDIDLAVSPQLYTEALEITRAHTTLGIDLHEGLRRLDTLAWEDLFENSRRVKISGTDIRVLRPEDHLRVICVHWLGDGGEHREKLLDIYHLVKNRPENFDWERCLGVVSGRRRRWIVCTLGLAQRFLGLDLSGMPCEKEAADLPRWLVKTIEREWKSDRRLIPLKAARGDFRVFLEQAGKRLPPNPITATIGCEGDFDARTRIFYQLRDIFKRLKFRRKNLFFY